MMESIFFPMGKKLIIIKMCPPITINCTRTSKHREDIFLNELKGYFISLTLVGIASTHLCT